MDGYANSNPRKDEKCVEQSENDVESRAVVSNDPLKADADYLQNRDQHERSRGLVRLSRGKFLRQGCEPVTGSIARTLRGTRRSQGAGIFINSV